MAVIIYIIALIIEVLFLASFSIITLSLIISGLKGSPYVPTKNKELKAIFEQVDLKKGDKLYDLGCGDGRAIRFAVKEFGVKGVGYDVNTFLIWYSRFLAFIKGLKNIDFQVKNILSVDLKDANYIYIFLMPKLIKNLVPLFDSQLKKDAIVISHGFKIEGWEKKLTKVIKHEPFPTYYYKK